VYIWDTTSQQFKTFQSIPSSGCLGVTSFVIDSNTYIVTANINANNSFVYQWDAKANQFKQYQEISVVDPRKWKFATIDGGSYLATTDNTGYSSVFVWDEASAKFEFFQKLALNNPQDLCFYNQGSDSFLAVANGGNNPTNVYVWNGTAFDFLQSLSATQGSDVTAFEIDSQFYLSVASLSQVTEVYVWDSASSQYTLLQNLPSGDEDFSVTAYTIGSQPYLAVATVGSAPSYRGVSQIFSFNSQGLFELYQNISTLYTEKFAYFEIDGDSYMAAAYAAGNSSTFNLNSQVFKWVDV
jgi:hypothetical protein